MKIRRQFVCRAAEEARRLHSLGEIPVPVEEIAQRLGLVIKKVLDDDSISGFLVRDGAQSYLGVNAGHPITRQRFTIAHEIGHALLHLQENVYVDKKFRNSLSSEGTHVDEKEANLFAAELLMPQVELERDLSNDPIDLEDDEDIARLAKRYNVSQQAMSNRISYLGYMGI